MWRKRDARFVQDHAERHRNELQVREQPLTLELRQCSQNVILHVDPEEARSSRASLVAIRTAMYGIALETRLRRLCALTYRPRTPKRRFRLMHRNLHSSEPAIEPSTGPRTFSRAACRTLSVMVHVIRRWPMSRTQANRRQPATAARPSRAVDHRAKQDRSHLARAAQFTRRGAQRRAPAAARQVDATASSTPRILIDRHVGTR